MCFLARASKISKTLSFWLKNGLEVFLTLSFLKTVKKAWSRPFYYMRWKIQFDWHKLKHFVRFWEGLRCDLELPCVGRNSWLHFICHCFSVSLMFWKQSTRGGWKPLEDAVLALKKTFKRVRKLEGGDAGRNIRNTCPLWWEVIDLHSSQIKRFRPG